jgi:hypothetical protein
VIRKLGRLLLVLAIALAVPAQGAAAVSARMCMAFGHHEASLAQAQSAEHAHHADEAAPAGHSHSDTANGAGHCAPCVSCCAAASISTAAAVFSQLPPDREIAVHAATTPPEFHPDRLDRPPLAL